ncbi:MAG: SIMPL domain-containing protein [Actinomycetes bacterium]
MKIFRGIFFAILTFSVLAIAIHQNPSTAQRFVNVTGTGKTTVVPDTVRLDATVTNIAASSSAALSATSKSAHTFRKTLTTSGVLAKYIKTQTLTVNPMYSYSQNGTSKITGYQASQAFSVVIRSAANSGSIVSASQNAVGNSLQVNGVNSYVFDESAAEATARAQAIAIAKAKAQSYATLAGAKLGKINTIDESIQNSFPQPMMAATMNKSDAAVPSAQIDLGQQDVTVTVTTQWALN